jgi:tetratricopeptide (TPR) repeat protein
MLSLKQNKRTTPIASLFKSMTGSVRLLAIGMCMSLTSAFAQMPLPRTHYKYKITERVFRRVNDSFGRYRGALSLEIIGKKRNKKEFVIAQYNPQIGKITMDEELYDLCRKLGPDSLNALASVLGHELAHHYREHTWYETYGLSRSGKEVSIDEKKRMENEADFYGCYAAQLAGYNPDRAFPRIIEAIYQTFKIPANLHGYPSKQFRQDTYREKSQELRQLVTLFRVGQFLYAIKSYEEAVHCFQYLSLRFPSAEILSNQAACLLQQFLQANDHTIKKFIFPIEFDVTTRLSEGGRGRGRGEIEEAEKLLEKALQLNSEYAPARLNLACTYIFLENYPAAIGEINKGKPISPNAYTLRAIAYYHNEQPEKAKSDFMAARRQKVYGSEYNLRMFNQLSPKSWTSLSMDDLQIWCTELFNKWMPTASRQTITAKPKVETIANRSLSQVTCPSEVSIAIDDFTALCTQSDLNGVNQATISEGTKNLTKILMAESTFTGATSRGIRVGSSTNEMIKRYGQPIHVFPLPHQNYLYTYRTEDDQRLVFVSQDNKISQWALCTKP